MRTIKKLLLSTCLFSLTLPIAFAGTVTVITSFPKDLTQEYKKAFEKANPNITLEVLNKQTVAGIAFVRETPAGKRPDIFWASAPDAFEVLAQANLLSQSTDIANPDVPDTIGSFPVNDPNGYFMGQALAGYGIMYNTRFLKAKNLEAPTTWTDLITPEWFGNVGMTAPSRSGTMHLTVETILQGEGWARGWEILMMMSGNSAEFAERSFGVPDSINNGQYGAGPVVDFFGLSSKYSGFPVELVYPDETAVVPANIGLISESANPEEARKFIQFALSPEGQQLLLLPQISRLPVLPYDKMSNIPDGYPNPHEIAQRTKVAFDVNISQNRYSVVQTLFDQTVTYRHKELISATKAIWEAEKKVGDSPSSEAKTLLDEAKTLAWTPLLGEDDVTEELLELFRADKKDPKVSSAISKLEGSWNTQARNNYREASELAKKAARL